MPIKSPQIQLRQARSQLLSSSSLCRPCLQSLQLQNRTQSHQQTRSIRSIRKKSFPISRHNDTYSSLGASPASAIDRRKASDTLPLRTGVLAIKKGMTALYDPITGIRTPCTVLQMDRVQVVGHKTRERHGYDAVCIGHGWRNPERVGKAMLGVFASAIHKDERTGGVVGVSPKRDVREFRVRDVRGHATAKVGKLLAPSWFQEGQFVDARANTRGMGFAGGMKRHGFSGQPASHGNSLTHRAMGSAGGSQGSGSRVLPGKKMPGRMGGQRHTVQNLRVLKVDDQLGIVVISGTVPGPKKCVVQIQDALKKPWPEMPIMESPKAPVVDESTATTKLA